MELINSKLVRIRTESKNRSVITLESSSTRKKRREEDAIGRFAGHGSVTDILEYYIKMIIYLRVGRAITKLVKQVLLCVDQL